MNVASLIAGFILGVVATFVFMIPQKSSANTIPNATKTDDAAAVNNQSNQSKQNSMLAVFVLVLILAGLIYWKIGNPNATGVNMPANAMPAADISSQQVMPADHEVAAGHEMGDLSEMAQKLADKLAKNPENGDGWVLLAHSYVELKEHKNAASAFSKAVELIPNDPQLLADYADALAITNNGNFEGKSAELVEKALKIDPNHPKALLLAGTIAFNKADYAQAISRWEQLTPLIPKDDPILGKQLEANIAEAKSLLNKK